MHGKFVFTLSEILPFSNSVPFLDNGAGNPDTDNSSGGIGGNRL